MKMRSPDFSDVALMKAIREVKAGDYVEWVNYDHTAGNGIFVSSRVVSPADGCEATIKRADGGVDYVDPIYFTKVSPKVTEDLDDDEAAKFNFEVLQIVFNYLLENDLVSDTDIPAGPTPADAAQTYINVYERLRSKK